MMIIKQHLPLNPPTVMSNFSCFLKTICWLISINLPPKQRRMIWAIFKILYTTVITGYQRERRSKRNAIIVMECFWIQTNTF